MPNNLVDDIRNDSRFSSYLRKVFFFLFLLLLLDFVTSLFLEKGIDRFYGLGSNSDVLMVGHSHLMLAVDKQLFEQRTGMRVAKYTREGVNVADRHVMLEQYFSGKTPNCRLIVYGIDSWLFTGKGLSANSYKLFYPFMDNRDVDAYIRRHAANRFDYFGHKFFRSSRFNPTLINAALRGYLGNWSNLKIGRLDTLQLRKDIVDGNYRRVSFDRDNIEIFKKTLPFLSTHAETVILLNTPISGMLVGAVRRDYDRAMALMRDMAAPYPNIHVVDLSSTFEGDPQLFHDPIHMNPDGQRRVTTVFSALADSILAISFNR